MSGKIIVIVAPSGTGKSTMINEYMNEYSDLKWSVSSTTRSPRQGETDGVDYNFITEEEFQSKIKENAFVEYAKVHPNYYGTEKKVLDDALGRGDNVLLDIDVQGCDSLKKLYGEQAKIIFIAPPSIEVLEERLRRRGTETEKSISVRMDNARKDMKRKHDFDYYVLNDDYRKAYSELKTILTILTKS